MPHQNVYLASSVCTASMLTYETFISSTTVFGSTWLDLLPLHSSYELKINYTVKGWCKCFFHAYFMSASTHAQ